MDSRLRHSGMTIFRGVSFSRKWESILKVSEKLIHPMVPQVFRIKTKTAETADTFTLDLVPDNGVKEFAFLPGQFNMIYVYGVGEAPISICGDPGKKDVLVHTIRSVGTVTRVIDGLKPGAVLGVRGPFGSSWPVEEAVGKDVVIVTGGIGLPPLRPALYHIFANRNKYGRVVLLYGARTPKDLVYKDEIKKWQERKDLEMHVTVDMAESEWKGNVGVVTTLIPKAKFTAHDTVAMTCGPEIMMRFVVQELYKQGVSYDNIYISMERNMKCGIGVCGHCQLGPTFVCKNGPVFSFESMKNLFGKKEI